MKIIFCDVDGVLNNLRERHEKVDGSGDVFAVDYKNWNKHAVKRIDDLCYYTGAQVVISSSWRKLYPDYMWWNEQFKLAGAKHIWVVDVTGDSHNGFRGREINDYLLEEADIDRYVILDDESDFYPDQPRVYVDMYGGLLNHHFLEALMILEGKMEPKQYYCMEERNPLP